MFLFYSFQIPKLNRYTVLLLFLCLAFLDVGLNYLQWYGPQAQLVINDPELIKELLQNKNGGYPKKRSQGYGRKLLGDGLITSRGEKWAKVRKLANHAFHAKSLKVGFLSSCSSCCLLASLSIFLIFTELTEKIFMFSFVSITINKN